MRRFVGIVVLFALGWCVNATSATTLQVMLDFFANPNHVPLVVASEQGFFADEGIDVDIVVPSNASDPVKLVAAGAIDVALTPQINFLIARAAGLPVIAIGSLIDSPLGGLLCMKDDGIETLADLRGRRIGYSLAPLEPILWKTMLASVGIGADDFELVNVGFNTVLSLLSGQVDAIGAFRNFEVPQVAASGHGPVFFPEEDYGVPQTEEILLVANSDTLSKHSVELHALIAGLVRGIEFTKAHPKEAFQIFLSAHPDLDDELNRRSYDLTVPLFSDGARLGLAAEWENLQDYLVNNGLMESRYSLDDLYTEEFIPQ